MAIPEIGLQHRALTDNRWEKDGEAVAPSRKRAEKFIDALRRGHNRPAPELDQTGGEGEASETVRRDPAHVDSPADSPPR